MNGVFDKVGNTREHSFNSICAQICVSTVGNVLFIGISIIIWVRLLWRHFCLVFILSFLLSKISFGFDVEGIIAIAKIKVKCKSTFILLTCKIRFAVFYLEIIKLTSERRVT